MAFLLHCENCSWVGDLDIAYPNKCSNCQDHLKLTHFTLDEIVSAANSIHNKTINQDNYITVKTEFVDLINELQKEQDGLLMP